MDAKPISDHLLAQAATASSRYTGKAPRQELQTIIDLRC
jgi:hypothetical protein